MGESWYSEIIGQDEAIMAYISSCNLACGVHHVSIGAHPSLPARENFGREIIDLPESELYQLILEQVKRLQAETEKQGRLLHHLKPHGALYNLATISRKEAVAVCKVCQETGIKRVYGPPNSELERQAIKHKLTFVPEGFIDRVYANGLQLRSRKLPDAVIDDTEKAATQALLLARDGKVIDHEGITHKHVVKTLCLHGDHGDALEQIRAVRECFLRFGIKVESVG